MIKLKTKVVDFAYGYGEVDAIDHPAGVGKRPVIRVRFKSKIGGNTYIYFTKITDNSLCYSGAINVGCNPTCFPIDSAPTVLARPLPNIRKGEPVLVWNAGPGQIQLGIFERFESDGIMWAHVKLQTLPGLNTGSQIELRSFTNYERVEL